MLLQTGEEKKEFTVQAHDGLISSMSFNKERFLMLTTSADQTGKVRRHSLAATALASLITAYFLLPFPVLHSCGT